jgi:hypothetical protein
MFVYTYIYILFQQVYKAMLQEADITMAARGVGAPLSSVSLVGMYSYQ